MESIFNILVIAFIALIAYWWANQGILSALLHLICVIAAGALAFAGWEPISHIFLNAGAMTPYAWGIGLLLPFAVYLFVLRLIADKLAPDNLNFPHLAGLGIGGVLGICAGVLTVGISIIGAGHTHSGNQILNVQGAVRTATNRGQPDFSVAALWIPAHTITANFFSFLSTTSLRPTLTNPTLASEFPTLDTQALGLFRDTYVKDGRIARTAVKPGTITIQNAILVPDFVSPGVPPMAAYVVRLHFEVTAATDGTNFALSASQFRLVGKVRAGSGPGSGIAYPTAWGQLNQNGGSSMYVFDDKSHYITGVAGTQTLDAALVFPASAFAQGDAPRFLQAMGLRLPFPTIATASTLVDAMMLVMGDQAAAAPVIPNDVPLINPSDLAMTDSLQPANADLNSLPPGVKTKDGNWLFSGNGDFEQGGFRGNKSVVIKGIWASADTRVVRLNMSRGGTSSIDVWNDSNKIREKVGESARLSLVDDYGRSYYPIGYIHVTKSGDRRVTIWLDRSAPFEIQSFPNLSSAGTDELFCLFAPAAGRKIVGVKFGDQWIARADLSIVPKI